MRVAVGQREDHHNRIAITRLGRMSERSKAEDAAMPISTDSKGMPTIPNIPPAAMAIGRITTLEA